MHQFVKDLLNGEKVEWKKLGEVCELKRGKTITAKQVIAGDIPVISGSIKPTHFHNEANRFEETITIAGSGTAGFVSYWNKPIWVGDAFSVIPKENNLLTKYVYYFLNSNQDNIYKMRKGGIIQHVYPKDVAELTIPLPPLKVQQKIVDILDQFCQLKTALKTALKTEKILRLKQYAFYRDKLLGFGEGEVPFKKLSEIGEFIRGNGLTKKELTTEGFPAIHYGQIYTYYGTFCNETLSFVTNETAKKLKKFNTGDVIITNTSENINDVGKAVAYFGKEQGVTGGHATIFKPSDHILPMYFVYFTQTRNFEDQKRKAVRGVKVFDVTANDMKNFIIPLPPIEKQQEIVNILNQFDELTNNIVKGLPREIELREKQYYYYRDQLLNFEA